MCDTLVLRSNGHTWLAKNSDREAAEPERQAGDTEPVGLLQLLQKWLCIGIFFAFALVLSLIVAAVLRA